MSERLLIDTDVLIDYLRANPQAVDFLENLTQLILISSITVAELMQSTRRTRKNCIRQFY